MFFNRKSHRVKNPLPLTGLRPNDPNLTFNRVIYGDLPPTAFLVQLDRILEQVTRGPQP